MDSVGKTIPLLKKLRTQGVALYTLETGEQAKDINAFKAKFPCVLISGLGVKSAEQNILKLVDEVISIPVLWGGRKARSILQWLSVRHCMSLIGTELKTNHPLLEGNNKYCCF